MSVSPASAPAHNSDIPDQDQYPHLHNVVVSDRKEEADSNIKSPSILRIRDHLGGSPASALLYPSYRLCATKGGYIGYIHARFSLARLSAVLPDLKDLFEDMAAATPILDAYIARFAHAIYTTAALTRVGAKEPAANNCLILSLERFLPAYVDLSANIPDQLFASVPAKQAVPRAIQALIARAGPALTHPLNRQQVSDMAADVLDTVITHFPAIPSPATFCLLILPAALIARAINAFAMSVSAVTNSTLPARLATVYAAIVDHSPPAAATRCFPNPLDELKRKRKPAAKSAEFVADDELPTSAAAADSDAEPVQARTPVNGATTPSLEFDPVDLLTGQPIVPGWFDTSLLPTGHELAAMAIGGGGSPQHKRKAQHKTSVAKRPKPEPTKCPCGADIFTCRRTIRAHTDYERYTTQLDSRAVRTTPITPEFVQMRTNFFRLIANHPSFFHIPTPASPFLTFEQHANFSLIAFYWPSLFPGTPCPYGTTSAEIVAYINAHPALFVKGGKSAATCVGYSGIFTLHPNDMARSVFPIEPIHGITCRAVGDTTPEDAPVAPPVADLAAVVDAIKHNTDAVHTTACRVSASLDSLGMQVDKNTHMLGHLNSTFGSAMQFMLQNQAESNTARQKTILEAEERQNKDHLAIARMIESLHAGPPA